ncbi:fasciclin-1-like isoform X2 [Tachypleus tridentatus]|uniref:fasciclin-1-like isoform X2 n=1 Tax=Tachypleus tridentatus TaxID=6853 RepID=UPI003FD235CB
MKKFYDLTKNDELVQVLLKKRRVTVFVPSNEAFSRARQFAPEDEERLASYHIVSMVVTRDLFPDSIYAVSQENPPLYFSVKEQPGNGEKEYFVNNAKLLEDRDYNVDDGKQKLYIIDEVLEPYRSTENLPPDAWELLSNPSLYNIREELSAMASRVRKEEQVDTFTKVGNHTYFIPIGEENGPTGSRIRDVDSNVIKGHVISHYVLFTRTAGNEGYISNNPRVEIKFVNQSNSFDSETIFVRSNTFQENQAHHKGVVLSKIVRANIPLRNGVVHLIEHPLMIIDISVWDFIQSKGDKKLSEYMQLVKEASPDFDFNIRNAVEKTVFVPTNEAIQEVEPEKLEMLKANKTELTNLLRLHMTQKAISTDDVWRHGRHYEIITADNQRTMYFRAVGNYKNKSLTVEAGGVNASVVEADIGATNGIIHVIDRVLGLPYQTIMEKLSSDPDLRFGLIIMF